MNKLTRNLAEANSQNNLNPAPFLIKPSGAGELSKLYGVSPRTFGKWLIPYHEKIGERVGRYYSVVQIKIIFRELGLPHWIE